MADDYESLEPDLVRAVELLADAFASRSIRYAMIGGVAASMRGRVRFTEDVDVLLDVPQLALPGLLEELAQLGFELDMPTVMREYVRNHVTSFRFGSVRIDWLKPVLPFYAKAIDGASTLFWTDGHSLRVASAEGLILTKLAAFRSQDQADIEALLSANQDELDLEFLRRELASIVPAGDSRTKWFEEQIAKLGDAPPSS
jgi:hypothetical protein